jgi:3-oxoacyl-[acyl-carrier-protein] synthase III
LLDMPVLVMPALKVRISGMGKYLPERVVTNRELEEKLGLTKGWIERRTGVLERRYATHETTVSQAVEASKQALENAGLSVNDIDAIIGASSVPQQAIPCTAALLQRELGAPDGMSACFDINATCLGFLFALHQAALYISNGFYKRVLIFSSEIASPSLNPKEPESMCLFGDAAAAVIIEASDTSAILGASFETYSSGAGYTQILGGGTLHRPNVTSPESEHNLFHMDGPAVFKQAKRTMKPFMDDLLKQVGWSYEDVDVFVPHQASGHAVRSISQHMGFSPEQTIFNLPLRGNCVAASIPLALAEAVEDGKIIPGHKVILAGTAAGLTLGAVVLIF